MTRNKAAKSAARKRTESTGKYTAAVRQVRAEGADEDAVRYMRIPVSAIKGVELRGSASDDGILTIGCTGGHGVIFRSGFRDGVDPAINLMQAIASRYPKVRVSFLPYGFDEARLDGAGVDVAARMWKESHCGQSLVEFIDACDVELNRREALARAAGVKGVWELRAALGELPDVLVIVDIAAADRDGLSVAAVSRRLSRVLRIGRSLGVFLIIDVSQGDYWDDMYARHYLGGWELHAS